MESQTAMKGERQIVLMDVDTGVDDALAIMLAVKAPELEVVGFTTVSGNTSSKQAAWNTKFILEQFHLGNVPIAIGASESLNGRHPASVKDVHGSDGLGGVSSKFWKGVPSREVIPPLENAVEFLQVIAKKYGSNLCVVATGPFTNIALAIRKNPSLVSSIGKIVVMGGALDRPGNSTGFAEFNVHSDPEAFWVLVNSGIPVTLFPLDVTEKVRILEASLTPKLGIDEDRLELIKAFTKTYMEFHFKRYGFRGSYVHDALPVASLIDPSLFRFRVGKVHVDRVRSKHFGQVRWAKPGEKSAEITVAIDVDEKNFLKLFWTYLR